MQCKRLTVSASSAECDNQQRHRRHATNSSESIFIDTHRYSSSVPQLHLGGSSNRLRWLLAPHNRCPAPPSSPPVPNLTHPQSTLLLLHVHCHRATKRDNPTCSFSPPGSTRPSSIRSAMRASSTIFSRIPKMHCEYLNIELLSRDVNQGSIRIRRTNPRPDDVEDVVRPLEQRIFPIRWIPPRDVHRTVRRANM